MQLGVQDAHGISHAAQTKRMYKTIHMLGVLNSNIKLNITEDGKVNQMITTRKVFTHLYAKTHAVLRRVVEAGVVCVGELTPGCFFGQLLSTKRKPYDFEIYSNNQLRPCTKTESAQGRGNVTSSKLFDFTAHSRKSSSTR